jgi:hypothetical protein
VVVTTRGTGLQIVKHVSCAFWITTHTFRSHFPLAFTCCRIFIIPNHYY